MDIKKLMEEINNAKETPSEICTKGNEHDFQFMMHADGTDSFSNYFKCTHCSEVIVQTQKRTGTNKILWS